MTSLPNRQLVTLALGNLGGHAQSIHTEDIALAVDKLAPGQFSWRKYPEYIDINVVLQGLGDARRKRYDSHVYGSNVKGWMLSRAGQVWIKRCYASNSATWTKLIYEGKGSLIDAQLLERRRLAVTEAASLYEAGKRNDIALRHFQEFVRVNEYFSDAARKRRLDFVASSLCGNKQLEPLWQYLEQAFGSEFV